MQNSFDNKKFYLFELEDYSAASFTSLTKPYFGTEEQFYDLIKELDANKHQSVTEAFKEFVGGNREVEYYAGQIKTRFAKPIKILTQKDLNLGKEAFAHKNTWGCYYYVFMDAVIGTLYLGECDNEYYLFYNISVKNPRYSLEQKSTRATIHLLDGGFWGYPNQLKTKKIKNGFEVKTTLCPLESSFNDVESIKKRFNDLEHLDLSLFFEDCFGDG